MEVATSSQAICPRCEEAVHKYASSCPYCRFNLSAPSFSEKDLYPDVRSSTPLRKTETKVEEAIIEVKSMPSLQPMSKITQMPQSYKVQEKDPLPSEKTINEENTSAKVEASSFHFVMPLLCLLAGSFFFFFGLLIKLFSKNGQFVLEWSQNSWPYFLFPACAILILGLLSLPKNEN